MYKSLKKLSLRAILPRVIALVLCAVVLLAVTGFGIFRLASPVPADGQISSGDYVRFDLSQVVVAYASSSTSFGGEYTYYILDLGDGHYAALKASSGNASIFASALTQSQAYYHDKTQTTLDSLGYAYGTASKMTSTSASLLEEGRSSAELDGSITEIVVTLDRLGTLPKTATLIVSLIALVLIIIAAVPLIRALTGGYQKDVRLALDGDDAESEYAGAFANDLVRVGQKYFWYQTGAKSRCIPLSDIVWGFDRLDSRMLGTRRYSIDLYLRSGDCLDIRTKTEAERRKIANAIADAGNVFVYGYSQERAAAFARSREEFIRQVKNNEI